MRVCLWKRLLKTCVAFVFHFFTNIYKIENLDKCQLIWLLQSDLNFNRINFIFIL